MQQDVVNYRRRNKSRLRITWIVNTTNFSVACKASSATENCCGLFRHHVRQQNSVDVGEGCVAAGIAGTWRASDDWPYVMVKDKGSRAVEIAESEAPCASKSRC